MFGLEMDQIAKIKEIEQNKQSMLDLTEDTFISKIFGYFADN